MLGVIHSVKDRPRVYPEQTSHGHNLTSKMSEINISQADQADLHKSLELGLPKATAARTAYRWLKMLREDPEHKKLATETKFRLQPYLRLLDPEGAHKKAVEAEIKAETEKNRMEIDQASVASPDAHEGRQLVLLAKK